MTIVRVICMILGCISISSAWTLADEQPAGLPDNGWWIRYSRIERQNGIDGKMREYTEKLTYSLVGTTMEDGENCRWVEVNSVASTRGKEREVVWKFLISEKDLLEAEQPLDKVKRGWIMSEARGLRAVKIGQDLPSNIPILNVFPGVWQKSVRLAKERIIDYQQGRLTISQARSQTVKMPESIKRRGSVTNLERTLAVESTVWFDRATSPLIAAATLQFKSFENDEVKASKEVEIAVDDIGTDAQSKLPDNN